jgi:leucyl-tRNA synthetase
VSTYDFKTIEAKWQKKWEQDRLFACNTKSDRKKYYCLMMFPYPSGDLHVGHGRNYIIGDVITRYRLMNGYEVLSPMGWDAFGLPAENAAIKRNIHPATWTKSNIEKMKTQLKGWGVGYDWSRELATCDPAYYKWTQWIFLKLFERGLAYRKKAAVNWCPGTCQTVLANDQVVEGKCDRCGTEVTKRDLEQWFVKITDYAQRLLDDLAKLPKWSAGVVDRQRARIGRSEGALVHFTVKETGQPLPCYTTRPDTLWGVTYFSVAPEHPIVATIKGPEAQALGEFVERVKKQTNVDREKVKEGVATGLHVVNPVNGSVVPLYAANYVLPEYGTGGVMAVPAHDQRDFEFARKYKLPVKVVIKGEGPLDAATMKEAFEDDGIMVDSGPFTGKKNRPEGIAAVIAWLAETKKGEAQVNFKLHDWCVSRQRYWGAPIPMIHCPKDGVVPVPEKDLPVLLPDIQDFKPKGRSVLDGVPEFVNTKCPKCGGPAKRDPDTLDTFVDSTWYFLRYLDPSLKDRAFDKAIADKWLAVDQYVGGIEHATGHLLYSRFITKVLKDAGYLSFEEPFQALFTQGMIQAIAYRCDEHVWIAPKDVVKKGDVPTCPICGKTLKTESGKMSKSKLNAVGASEMGDVWGVDTQRVYTLAVAPADLDAPWLEEGVRGSHKFLRRTWESVTGLGEAFKGQDVEGLDPGALTQPARELRRKAHETIQKVTDDLEGRFAFHTALARLIELEHALPSVADLAKWTNPSDRKTVLEAVEILVVLLAPFAPHIAEELWHGALAHPGSVFDRAWPTPSEHALVRDSIEHAIQINGKVKLKAMLPADATEEQARELVLAHPDVKALLAGKTPKMVKVVLGRLVNIVVPN